MKVSEEQYSKLFNLAIRLALALHNDMGENPEPETLKVLKEAHEFFGSEVTNENSN